MKIALICNKRRDKKTLEARKLARKVEVWLKKNRHEVFWELNDKISKKLDLAIIFGGDGLVLFGADRLAPHKVPLFNINFGNLGFLTDIQPEETFKSLEDVLKGNFHIEDRNRVEAEIIHGGKIIKRISALNEIVIGGINRTVALKFLASYGRENFAAEAHGDGLIISTRTGSTAYNVNAGGPMLLTEDAFSVTANNTFLKPGFLQSNVKSFVAPIDCEFKVEIINQNRLNLPYIVADGQRSYKMKKGDYLAVKKSPAKTLLVKIGRKKKR